GTAALKQGDLGPFLICGADAVNAERREAPGERPVQLHSADAEAIAVSGAVFPDEVTTRGIKSQLWVDLVAWQASGDGIFGAIGAVVLGEQDGWRSEGQPEAQARLVPKEVPELIGAFPAFWLPDDEFSPGCGIPPPEGGTPNLCKEA